MKTVPITPILRQDDEGGYLQNCGHGKLLQTADGRWFLCFLCLRRDPDGTAPMGRETSIAEVTWTPDGWPVAAYGRRPRAVLNMPLPNGEFTCGSERNNLLEGRRVDYPARVGHREFYRGK